MALLLGISLVEKQPEGDVSIYSARSRAQSSFNVVRPNRRGTAEIFLGDICISCIRAQHAMRADP